MLIFLRALFRGRFAIYAIIFITSTEHEEYFTASGMSDGSDDCMLCPEVVTLTLDARRKKSQCSKHIFSGVTVFEMFLSAQLC